MLDDDFTLSAAGIVVATGVTYRCPLWLRLEDFEGVNPGVKGIHVGLLWHRDAATNRTT